MTGSGKTGLCIGLLEEAAIDNVPAIIIDPKGDIANLLLTFPDLQGSDFLPWTNSGDASALTKHKNPSQPGKRQIFIDVQNGIIRKMILYNKQNEETDSVTFSKIRKDSSISKNDFNFTPPKGTQIHEVKDVGSRMDPKK